jgi:drug/metabolite transporter (DMT)-like permease
MTAQPLQVLTGARHNLSGMVLMVVSMAIFAFEDALLKLTAMTLPAGQIILINGMLGAAFFAALLVVQRRNPLARAIWTGAPLARTLSEMTSTACYLTALTAIPLAVASAMLQATPILITAAAALFFGEKVGWRRWSAILAGLIGVLIILRPGSESFQAESLWAVGSALALSLRELMTRRIPPQLSGPQLAFSAFLATVPMGLVMMHCQGGWRHPDSLALLLLAVIFLGSCIGYLMIIAAARMGEVAVVTPFRYVRLPFAVLVAILLLSEWPDATTLLGSAMVIAAGLYTLMRERTLARARKRQRDAHL